MLLLGLGVVMKTEEVNMGRIYFGDPRWPGLIFVWQGGTGEGRERNLERNGWKIYSFFLSHPLQSSPGLQAAHSAHNLQRNSVE